ncbi:MAG: hypothetical protein R3D25_02775 [Geminicoccaceae bacterium]
MCWKVVDEVAEGNSKVALAGRGLRLFTPDSQTARRTRSSA